MTSRQAAVQRRHGVTNDVQLAPNEPYQVYLSKMKEQYVRPQKSLWLHGVDLQGRSVSLQILDFQPTFLCEPPRHWADDLADAEEDLAQWVSEVNEIMEAQYIEDVEFVHYTPLIGFTNRRRDRLIKITCADVRSFRELVKHLTQENYQLYHTDFKCANQFYQQTGIESHTWLNIYNFLPKRSNRMTHANVEGRIHMADIKAAPECTAVAPVLKMFLRVRTVSADGAREQKWSYQPQAQRPFDRIVAIGAVFTWGDDEHSVPCHTQLLTLFPEQVPNATCQPCSTELELLQSFQQMLVAWDPDDIIYFPDVVDTLSYIVNRILAHDAKPLLAFDRFRGLRANVYTRPKEDFVMLRLSGRHLMNLEAALRKKVTIQVERYDLYTTACMKAFVPNPPAFEDLKTDPHYVNRAIVRGSRGRRDILDVVCQDLELLRRLERDNSLRIEFANLARVADTDLSETVSRGEQIRVYNRLSHCVTNDEFYINKQQLGAKVLRFARHLRPPTCKDPEELPLNRNLRERCMADYQRKVQQLERHKKLRRKPGAHKLLEELFSEEKMSGDDEEKKDEETELEGGNVMKPSCKFWGKTRVYIYDFKSLYPSIMMAYNISYENVVYDPAYLDLPGVKYITVAINKNETVVLADQKGLVPKMLRMLVDTRDVVKKQMKREKNVFRKKVLNCAQNSVKILCNAAYGFFGATSKGSMLPMKEIMYMVTSLGRYLQKACVDYVGRKYNVPTIYGDSVTGETPVLIRTRSNPRPRYVAIKDVPTKAVELDGLPGKTTLEPDDDVEVYTHSGRFTRVIRWISHETDKKMYRVETPSGYVDVTEDHSLLDQNRRPLTPNEARVGNVLMTGPYPRRIRGESDLLAEFCPLLKSAYFWGYFVAVGSVNFEQGYISVPSLSERHFHQLRQKLYSADLVDSRIYHYSWQKKRGDVTQLHSFKLLDMVRLHMLDEKGQIKIPDLILSTSFIDARADFYMGAELSFVTIDESRFSEVEKACLMEMRPHYNLKQTPGTIFRKTLLPEQKRTVYDLETDDHTYMAGVGNLVVHNTDSIFVILPMWKPLDNRPVSVAELCLETGRMYQMENYLQQLSKYTPLEPGFTWTNLVHYWQTARGIDITKFTRDHQINAVMYVISDKLCVELTALFPHPVIMEFENLGINTLMTEKKKNYQLRIYKEHHPAQVDKIKCTGLAQKKRDFCTWTRNSLWGVSKRILDNRLPEIKTFLVKQLDDLVAGRVPISDLRISKGFKGWSKYKDRGAAHLQVVMKIETRTRAKMKPEKRFYMVILQGSDQVFTRSETPEYALEHKLKLDLLYYLRHQFVKPMQKLLVWFPELLNFRELLGHYVYQLQMMQENKSDVTNRAMFSKPRLSIEMIQAKKRSCKRAKKSAKNMLVDYNPFPGC